MWHSKADGDRIAAVPIYCDGIVCGSVPVKASGEDMAAGNDGDDRERDDAKNVWCSGCWQELPEVCRCDATRWCVECADGFATVRSEAGDSTGQVVCNGVGEELVSSALREELLQITRNFRG